MKVKFAIEKSMYSNLLQELLNPKDEADFMKNLIKMGTIEEIIKAYGDEIITVVSTRDTYDGPPTANPMKTWNKEKEVMEVPDDVPEPVVEEVVVVPSPKCKKCPHKMISHRRKGCRFCDCEEKRPL